MTKPTKTVYILGAGASYDSKCKIPPEDESLDSDQGAPNDLYDDPTALLLPAGKHKGLALGMMVDVSTVALTGKSRTVADGDPRKVSLDAVNNGWLAFHRIEGKEHHDLLRGYAEMVAQAAVIPGTKRRGLLPGVRASQAESRARVEGVLIPDEIWQTVLDFHKTNKLPEMKM